MPRLRRLLHTGRIFFVTTNLQRELSRFTKKERTLLCKALEIVRGRQDFQLAGFVIMPDHVHFLIAPHPGVFISKVIQEWKRTSSLQINRLRNQKGQLWQKGFFDRFMRTPKEVLETLEYIHLNPVKKALVKEPTDWQWSSASAYRSKTCPVAIDFLQLPAQQEN